MYSCNKLREDLANQVRFSLDYKIAIRAKRMPPGQYLSIPAAEWFQGRAFFDKFIQVLSILLFERCWRASAQLDRRLAGPS